MRGRILGIVVAAALAAPAASEAAGPGQYSAPEWLPVRNPPALAGLGDSHGFEQNFETSKRGSQPVCAYAIDAGPGDDVALGCKTVTIEEPPPPAPVAEDPPAAPAPPAGQLTPAAVAVRFKPSVRRGRALRLTCTGIADGTRLVVRWRPRRGPAVRRTAVVERGRASVKAPRKRGRYTVRVTLGGGLLRSATVRVR